MAEEREKKLARHIIRYACGVQAGDRILIDYQGDTTRPMACELIREAYAAGGLPFVHHLDMKVQKEILMGCTREQMELLAATEGMLMERMDCYVAIRGVDNSAEYVDVPAERMAVDMKYHYGPVHLNIRIPKTRWSVTRYPSDSMAQNANMSLDQLRDLYFRATTIDIDQFCQAQKPLCDLMSRTDQVRVLGPGTDLSFSIKGQQCTYDDGHFNIPCGEVGTAPILETLNGVITYNLPALKDGFIFRDICFKLERGRIVEATANDSRRLNQILGAPRVIRVYFTNFVVE